MKIHQEITDHLVCLTKSYNRAPHGPHIIYSIQSQEHPSSWRYLQPPVILWDPLAQFPDYFPSGILCPHESHSIEVCPISPKKWKHGETEKDAPRQLYGKGGTVLLVSRVYVCCQGHEIMGHDNRILEKIPDALVPFYLSHKSGVTKGFKDLVNALASTGQTFNEIERHIAQEYYNLYWDSRQRFNDAVRRHRQLHGIVDCRDDFPDESIIDLPSDDTIISCFVLNFRENEIYYTQRMSELSAVYISADHTFKVAANIGINLPDQKWVTQYDSLFCVLNEKGQVLAWQLTKGTSLIHVEELLRGLKARLDKQGITLQDIYVDNCCQVKKKIRNIFGDTTRVKLDLYHGVARVTQKIPKSSRHTLSGACIIDFVNVFREDDDKEKERKRATPSPEKMSTNLQKFVHKWGCMKHGDHEDVLNAAALSEIECLKKHIVKGCLSDIPPGAGSEKNENLHKNLRHIIARSRLGVEPALALLASFFFSWNERKEERYPKGVVAPITYYEERLKNAPYQPTTEHFGIIKKEVPSTSSSQILKFLSATSKIFELHDSIAEFNPSEPLEKVLTKGLNTLLVEKFLRGLNNCRDLNSRLIHLMPCTLTLFHNESHQTTANPEDGMDNMKRVLSQYGLQLGQVSHFANKEDSFFISVVEGLTTMKDEMKAEDGAEYQEVLATSAALNLSLETQTIASDIAMLRRHISQEWLNNTSVYKKLILSSDLNFTEEAENFMRTGYFKDEMGNLLAIAAAKVIRLSLVIFSSLEYIPVVPVVPVDPVLCSRCILVGYSAATGYYYSVERASTEETTAAVGKKGAVEKTRDSCKCGRGASKQDGTFCIQKVGGIPSRCGCYRAMRGCSEKCRCMACANPYGTSRNAKSTYTLTRTRQPSKLKGQGCKSGTEFLLYRGAMPVIGWSDIESTIFDCLVDYITSEDVELNASTCLERYNDLRVVAEKQGIHNIGPKTVHQVQGKLTQVKKCAAAYEAFYKKQIERNWFNQSTPQ